jgi:mRNA interferase RelE/StbE
MSWTVTVDDAAKKQLKRIPRRDALRIISVLEKFGDNPFAGDIEKMKGEEFVWRRRVGNFRVLYELHVAKKTVAVFNIERRTSSTY